MAHIALSLADLMMIPSFAEAYGKQDEDDSDLKNILYQCGVNTDKEFNWHFCTHRRLNNEVITCPRLEGIERIDREWLESGSASYDARVDSYDDISFRVELRKMQHIGCIDKAFEEDI